MRLKNYTNFSDEKIREIIKFVKLNGLFTSNFDVKVTNSSHSYCGRFFMYGGYSRRVSAMGARGRPLIITRVTKDENEFPHFMAYEPTRVVKLYYDIYNKKKGVWERWHSWSHVAKCSVIKRKLPWILEDEHWSNWRIIKPKNGNTGGYIDHLTLSREEALVNVLAHEFRHLWQVNHPRKRGKVCGARGKFSDRDADAYAINKTRAWRVMHNHKDATQIGRLNWHLLEQGA